MPNQEALELADIILSMPREKRAKVYNEATDAGIVFDFDPTEQETFLKAVGAFTPQLPDLPKIAERQRRVETVYGPHGAEKPVLQLDAAKRAATQDIEKIAANKPRSLNPLDWIMPGGKSPIPALVEGGANFLAGAKDELLQGKPGPWQTRLLGALARGGLNVAAGEGMNRATGREPEAASAHNIANILTPSLPGGKGIGLNALSTGAAETADTGSVASGLGAAALSGGMQAGMKGVQAGVRSGIAAPGAREDLANELYKLRHTPPSAKGGFDSLKKNAELASGVTPEERTKFKNYRPENFQSRIQRFEDDFSAKQQKLDDELQLSLSLTSDAKTQAYRQEKHRIASDYLLNKHKAKIDELDRARQRMDEIAAGGFNIKDMDEPTWAEAKQLVKENEQEAYSRVVDPIFSAQNYSDLPKAAKQFNQNVTNVATLAGKERAAVLKGVRNAFVTRLFQDDDVMAAGQIVNPDSLRYRVEQIGPDMFNQIFSDSPSSKSQASGAYDAFKTIIDLAERGSRTNKTHDLKVLLTKMGPWIFRIPFGVGKAMEIPLGTDAPAPGKHGGLATAALLGTGYVNPAAAGLYAGFEVAEYTWDKFFDTFAKKNSRTLPILKGLTDPTQNFSATSVDRAIQVMFDNADTKKKRILRGENWEDQP